VIGSAASLLGNAGCLHPERFCPQVANPLKVTGMDKFNKFHRPMASTVERGWSRPDPQ
jgi:hypothetical protein